MPLPLSLRIFLFFACITGLSACAPSIMIESQKSPQGVAPPQRLFIDLDIRDTLIVPGNLWQPKHDEADAFGAYSIKALENCGIKAAYNEEKFLSLKKPHENPFGDFSPDTVLRVVVSSEHPAQEGVFSAIYQLSLIDVKKPAVIWQAKVTMDLRGSRLIGLGQTLAKEILSKMQADDLIPQSCILNVSEDQSLD